MIKQSALTKNASINACEGWHGLINDTIAKIESIGVTNPIKSINAFRGNIEIEFENSDLLEKILHEAKTRAWKTCEVCGAPAHIGFDIKKPILCASCMST